MGFLELGFVCVCLYMRVFYLYSHTHYTLQNNVYYFFNKEVIYVLPIFWKAISDPNIFFLSFHSSCYVLSSLNLKYPVPAYALNSHPSLWHNFEDCTASGGSAWVIECDWQWAFEFLYPALLSSCSVSFLLSSPVDTCSSLHF